MKKINIAVIIMAGSLLTGCIGEKNLEKGVELLEEQKYEEALDAFQKELEDDENLAEASRGMGIAYYEMEDYEKAIQSFEEALDNGAKETGTIYNFIGVSAMRLEEYEKALEAFEKGLEMEDASDELKKEMQFNSIISYEKTGNWEKAKEKVNEYLKQYPDDKKASKEAEFLESR